MMARPGPQPPPLCVPLDVHAPIHSWVTLPTREDASDDLMPNIRTYASELPALDSLPPGAWIAVRFAPERHGLWARTLRNPKHRRLRLAECCTALLAAGYERICVDQHEHAFARVPAR
jgi:hypothetical protein